MFDRTARRIKDTILLPIVAAVPQRVSPTMITIASLPVGIAAAVAAATQWWTVAFWLFVGNRVLDGLDGLLSRERALQSDLGGYLDIMVDFVIYAAIPIGVWMGTGRESTLFLLVLLAVFYVNAASWMYLAAIVEKRGAQHADGATERERVRGGDTSIVMPSGIIEGSETVLFYAAFLLFPQWSALLFAIMAALTAAGIAQRAVWAWRSL
jgi:phosphatidylglycerophosphate synthase